MGEGWVTPRENKNKRLYRVRLYEYERLYTDCGWMRNVIAWWNLQLLFARPAKQIHTANGVVDAYAYVGSANLSESAW